MSYTYNAQNKLIQGTKDNGESSTYTYNALGVRIENEQVRINQNAGYQNSDLKDGSHGVDYADFLRDGRADWQRAWETEIGTTVQADMETVTRHYIVDYLSVANRDLLVTEDGSYTTRYVYDANGTRLSAEFDYAPGTQRGEGGENLQTDRAVAIRKVWYRTSLLGSTLFAVDADGEVVAHMIYDPWGNPLVETYPDANFSGLENLNNFTGYTWDETLGLYFAQNRFYDTESHRFTQEDVVKDGANWYVYCGNGPVINIDFLGLRQEILPEDDFDPSTREQLYVALGSVIDLGDGWKARIERGTSGKQYQRHVHIYNGSKEWSQNEDGSPHDQNNNSSGSPPRKAKEALKNKKGWDWDKKEKDWLSKIEISIDDAGIYYIKYPNGRIVTIKAVSKSSIPQYNHLTQEMIKEYYSGPTCIDPNEEKKIEDITPVFPLPEIIPIPIPIPYPMPIPFIP